MTKDHPLSRETVKSISRHLGIETSPERDEQIHGEIAAGLDGYDILTPDTTQWSPTAGRNVAEVTVDSGLDDDPHDAFISLFEFGGDDGPLSDISVTVKDNIAFGGVRMTCGSEVFADAVPEGDAMVVKRLLDAGATLVGKANMDELAYAQTGETSTFGPAKNPVAPGRVTGWLLLWKRCSSRQWSRRRRARY